MRLKLGLIGVAVLAAAGGCSSGRNSPADFHLPSDGDIERGKAAFVALGCNSCHEVSGVDLPRPTMQPPVPVVLGGTVYAKITDAYLVTSIINPSFELAPYPKSGITVDGKSRMPHDTEALNVRQLTDVVAFIQSRYIVQRLPETYH